MICFIRKIQVILVIGTPDTYICDLLLRAVSMLYRSRGLINYINLNPLFERGARVSILIRPECVSVCAWEISEQLNQENGKSYGTGFFDKVQI